MNSVYALTNTTTFYARRLYCAMDGLGTNDSRIIRICVSRAEVIMSPSLSSNSLANVTIMLRELMQAITHKLAGLNFILCCVRPLTECNVRSNTRYVYRVVSPSAACQLNHRLRPLERYKRECGDCTRHVGPEILDSKGTGRCY